MVTVAVETIKQGMGRGRTQEDWVIEKAASERRMRKSQPCGYLGRAFESGREQQYRECWACLEHVRKSEEATAAGPQQVAESVAGEEAGQDNRDHGLPTQGPAGHGEG